jgi:predicted component of type VI protein secretion system
MYDELPEAEFVAEIIGKDLEELYPTMETENLTLKEHLACATEVLQYLMDFLPEIQAVGADRVCRYASYSSFCLFVVFFLATS